MLHLQFYYFVVQRTGMGHCTLGTMQLHQALYEILTISRQWIAVGKFPLCNSMQMPEAKGSLAGISPTRSSDRTSIQSRISHLRQKFQIKSDRRIHHTTLFCVQHCFFFYFLSYFFFCFHELGSFTSSSLKNGQIRSKQL